MVEHLFDAQETREMTIATSCEPVSVSCRVTKRVLVVRVSRRWRWAYGAVDFDNDVLSNCCRGQVLGRTNGDGLREGDSSHRRENYNRLEHHDVCVGKC